MDEHVTDRLPFYLNETLPVVERASIQAHISVCSLCQQALKEWTDLARGVRAAVFPQRPGDFPALSPVVRANLRGRPSFAEAILETASLIGAQRIYLKENGLIQIVSAILLIAVTVILFLPVKSNLLAVIPFLILVPFCAVIEVSLLETREAELGDEIIAATPTHPGILVFARLTLAIGLIASLAMIGSLLLSGLGRYSLAWLVAAWLGPMLWLSALATLLALLWNAWIAAGSAVALWGGILLLLVSDGNGAPLVGFSLAPLLYPSWLSFGVQVILAGCLWFACWLWLFWGAPPALRLERSDE